MSTPPNNPTPENANWVYACPECDRAGQLHERQDGSVRCYECGAEVDHAGELTMRADRRGKVAKNGIHKSRGGRNHSPPSDVARRAGKQGGRPPKAFDADD